MSRGVRGIAERRNVMAWLDKIKEYIAHLAIKSY